MSRFLAGAKPAGAYVDALERRKAGYSGFNLLACDGGRSTVRHQLGIAFEGKTYPDRILVMGTPFDFKSIFPDLREVNYISDPGNYARLMTNINANSLAGRIETIPLALGNEASEVILYEGAKWNRGESTIVVPEQTPQEVTFRVRQARFDDQYALKDQSIIVKMDVEGYEFKALEGMERTLRDNACYLQVEHYGTEFERLREQFAGYGYRFLRTRDIDHFFTNMPDVG